MFQPDYFAARAAFRDLAERHNGSLSAWEIIAPENGQEEGLTIDAAVFGTGPKTLVLTSGLHGVEGFTGSAIQAQMIQTALPKDIRVVMVHALNPYGMANIRRVNENNVDLNRNFLGEKANYKGSSLEYQQLDHLLNPTGPSGGVDFMLTRTVIQIARHGYNTLKTALVGGQYDFPKGLFFGGNELERGPEILLRELVTLVGNAEEVVLIDFHTGLGKSGTYALLVDAEAGSAAHIHLHEHYGERIQPWSADHGVAYKIRGGLPEAVVRHLAVPTQVLTCEFGTLPGLRVLQALRTENQSHHWGGTIKADKQRLFNAFKPPSKKWEAAVLHGGAHVIEQALAQLRS